MKIIIILIVLLTSIGFSDQCDKIEGSQEFIDCKVKMVEESESKPTGWISPNDNYDDLTKVVEYQIQPDMRRYFTLVQQEASLDVSGFTFGMIGLGATVTALLVPKHRTPLLVMSVVSFAVSFGFNIGRIVTVKQIEVFAIKYNRYHQHKN